MAITLVIKDADFSTNKLTSVTLYNRVQCTGISLNHSTLDVDYGDTNTLTATVTPADTTDTVTWTTSDSTVATVANGVVTPVGVGVATITATCGDYSDSCVVTIKAFMPINTANVITRAGKWTGGIGVVDSGNGLPTFTADSTYRGGFAASTGTLHFYNGDDTFPYVFPQNTKRIKISKNDADIICPLALLWLNSQTPVSSQFNTIATLLKNIPLGDFDETASVWTVEVPTYAGYPEVDSFAVSFKSDSVMTTEILSKITIEFLPTEVSS